LESLSDIAFRLPEKYHRQKKIKKKNELDQNLTATTSISATCRRRKMAPKTLAERLAELEDPTPKGLFGIYWLSCSNEG
jgi:hypothetical protein